MAENVLVAVIAGLFGLMFGSFLNVCIVRWPAEQSVIRPRSRCPGCGYQLAWYDNIPIVSWVRLQGRCGSCGIAISPMYPMVELLTALIWAGMALRTGLSLETARGAVLFTILLGIAMTDAREYLIPDEFSVGGLVLGLLFAAAAGLSALTTAVLGAAVGFGVLWTVGAVGTWIFKEEAMGGGDIKMMAMVGAFLGALGALLTILLGAVAGVLIFIPLTLRGKKKLVPFGVFLAVGAGLTYLIGPAIVSWYRGFIGLS